MRAIGVPPQRRAPEVCVAKEEGGRGISVPLDSIAADMAISPTFCGLVCNELLRATKPICPEWAYASGVEHYIELCNVSISSWHSSFPRSG